MRDSALRSKNQNKIAGSPLREFYLKLLRRLDQGDFESVSEELRRYKEIGNPRAFEALRRLMSARIAIFRGETPENVDWLKFSVSEEPWLEAEALCILGVHQFHLGRDADGAAFFAEARHKFAELGLKDREALAAYNVFIGKVNADLFPELSRRLAEIQELENFILSELGHSQPGLLALVLRQKSYLFEEEGRFHAALEMGLEAVRLFGQVGPKSDHHLALLQTADLFIRLGELTRARGLLEQVVPPLEVRVEFPVAYIEWRLGGRKPKPEAFEFVSRYWREKLEKEEKCSESVSPGVRSLVWEIAASRLMDPITGQNWELKASGREGQVVRALQRGKQGKNFLIDLLWPEHADATLLDNRLHRLVSRVNKRFKGLIVFDGQFYRLSYSIEIR